MKRLTTHRSQKQPVTTTVATGRKHRSITFRPGESVDVSDAEFTVLKPLLGVSLCEASQDPELIPVAVEVPPEVIEQQSAGIESVRPPTAMFSLADQWGLK